MFNFLFGWLFARNTRNSGMPDSLKQQRYDERREARAEARSTYGEKAIGNRGFWPLVWVLVGACVVGIALIALLR